MSGSDENTNVAVLRLISSARAEDQNKLNQAMRQAFSATWRSLEEDLRREHLPELEDRHSELAAFQEGGDPAAPLTRDTWLLVLSHLPSDMQLLLQAIYEELERGAETALEYGEQTDGEAQSVMQALAPVEDLLVELPYTTLTRSLGPDDHDLRLRTLSTEIELNDEDSKDFPSMSPVRVEWRDGYESLVATLTAWWYEEAVRWTLDIRDPPPGRATERVVPCEQTSFRETVKTDLDDTIAWATGELDIEGYVVVRDTQLRG